MNTFWRQSMAVLGKELRVELRTREIVYTMVFFGLVIVVIFGFGLYEKSSAAQAAPGVLWTALLLAGTTSVNRTFEREREGSCITGLMLVPGISWSLFMGKALANLLFLLVTLALVAPLVLLVFQFTRVPNPHGVGLALLLGAIGYSVLGTLVGGMLSQVRMRAILLPLVLFPMVIPVFGIGVTATSDLLRQGDNQTITFRVEAVEAGETVSVDLNDKVFSHVVAAGDDPAAIAETLATRIERASQADELRAIGLSKATGEQGFTLVATPGTFFEYDAVGISTAKIVSESTGWSYLPVLAVLDLILLVISIWLFGRLLETA